MKAGLPALLLFLAACGDRTNGPSEPAALTPRRTETPQMQRHDSLAAELARGMAQALGDPLHRDDMRRSMRATMQREHKLPVQDFLTSSGGERLAGTIRGYLDLDAAEFRRLLDSLPALEMYLPVESHRSTWRGGEIMVAAALHEREAPRGFRASGAEAFLSETAPPIDPVLVLTKAEASFSRPLDAQQWRNSGDADGTIGTMIRRSPIRSAPPMGPAKFEECDPETAIIPCPEDPPPGGGGSPAQLYQGIWIHNLHFNDYEEPWYRGTAEIQAVLVGPAFNGFQGQTLSCSGQYALTQVGQNHAAHKYFDQSGHDWSRNPYLLEGLLFGPDDLAQFGQVFQANVPISIEFWEDDTGEENCGFHGGADTGLESFINDVLIARGVFSQIVRIFAPGAQPISLGLSVGVSIRQILAGGDDIPLGRAINVPLGSGTFSTTQYDLLRPQNFFGVYTGIQNNGSLTLTIVQP